MEYFRAILYIMSKIDWHFIFEGLSAVSTSLAVIIAIFGDWLKQKVFPLKMKIVPENLSGIMGYTGNSVKTVYYHLKVVNRTSNILAKNCKVIIDEIHKMLPDGTWEKLHIVGNLHFKWSP